MKVVFIQFIVSLALPGFLFAQAQDSNTYHKEIIRVHKNGNGFTRQVVSHFSLPSGEKKLINIPYNPLEKINKLKITYTLPNGKKRKIAKKHIVIRSLTSTIYYDGMRAMSYQFAPHQQARNIQIKYQKSCSELFFLSELSFARSSYSQAVQYELYIPSHYSLSYKIDGNTSLLEDFHYTKNSTESGDTLHIFKALPSASSLPLSARLIVHETGKSSWQALQDWYADLLRHSTLNETSKRLVDQLKSQQADTCVYNIAQYLKTNIRYIDIEDGINAVRPRDVNEVLKSQQGDCKDISNLFCQMLNYAGIPAHPALTSTKDYPYRADFPALSSFNHMIASVEYNGKFWGIDLTAFGKNHSILSCKDADAMQKIFIINDAEQAVLRCLSQ